MIRIELHVSPEANFSKAEQIIDQCCALEELSMTLKTTLSKYPGSIHWHFKKEEQSGTLEITAWEKKRRIWFSVQRGRNAKWIQESIVRLKPAISRHGF